MDRHRDDEVFDALHAMGDVESSPLGLDGRYADGRIEPATFIYSHVRRLVPGPFKKAVPRIAVGLLFASLGMVFVRMLTGIETGWLAAVLRVGDVYKRQRVPHVERYRAGHHALVDQIEHGGVHHLAQDGEGLVVAVVAGEHLAVHHRARLGAVRLDLGDGAGLPAMRVVDEAVSYTHLDVYKRQVLI